MGIIVKQFDGVSVTPKDDAVINDLLFSSYGIFDGCGISFLGVNQLLVNSGRMIIKGRQVVITEETIAAQLSTGGTKRGRLYIRMDLSSPTKPAEFLTQVADALPALTQEDDANYNDGIFEVELCNYDVSEVAISNIVESCPVITGGMDMLKTMEEVMANTTEGKAVDSLVIKELNRNFETLGGFTPIMDETGKITGYKTKIGGADTVFPFKSDEVLKWFSSSNTAIFTPTTKTEITYTKGTKCIVIICTPYSQAQVNFWLNDTLIPHHTFWAYGGNPTECVVIPISNDDKVYIQSNLSNAAYAMIEIGI